MTDKDLPAESSQPNFRSRRERREYDRTLRPAQHKTTGSETDATTRDDQHGDDTETVDSADGLNGATPRPLAADGSSGQQPPQRPIDDVSHVDDPDQVAGDEQVIQDRQTDELEELPEDTRDYPELADLQDLTDDAEEPGEDDENPLGYMLVADGNTPLLEPDEEELKARQIRKRRRTLVMLSSFAVFLGLLTIVGLGVGQLVGWNNADFPGPGGEEVAFEVHPGEGAIIIGNRLVEENIVASTGAFRDAVEAMDTTAEIQPGEYTLQYEMPARDAAEILLRVGVPGMNYAHINSGYRIDDVYEHLAERTSYDVEQIEEAADPANFEVPEEADTLEGYVAVGEYHFPIDASLQEIFEIMIEPTLDEFDRLDVTDGAEQHRLVTVASMLEAEARPEDFEVVAGIIDNRLDSSNTETNGYLQIDATVIYGMGVRQLQFTAEDRQDASNEYNTYQHPGLPPGPIGAPSIRALDAAADPADSEYYYWITTNIETGETHFSETLEEHQEYQAEYRQYCDENPEICGRG